jgi:hypothetical protein
VVAAGDSQYKELARNTLSEPIYASPAISQGKLFIRTTAHLYAIGPQQPSAAGK